MSTVDMKSLDESEWVSFSGPPNTNESLSDLGEGEGHQMKWVQFPALIDGVSWNFPKELDLEGHTECLLRAEKVAARQLRILASVLTNLRVESESGHKDPGFENACKIRCLSAVHRLGIAVALANRVRNYLRVGYNDYRAFLYLENPLAYCQIVAPLLERALRVRLFCMHLIDLACDLDVVPQSFAEDWRRRCWVFWDKDSAWPGFNSFVLALREESFAHEIETMDPEALPDESTRSKILHRVFRPLAKELRVARKGIQYDENREKVLRGLLNLVARPDIDDAGPQLKGLLAQMRPPKPKKNSCVLL